MFFCHFSSANQIASNTLSALAGSDDSRIARQRLCGEPGIPIAFDREFGLSGSYVHRRPIRSPVLRSDNRNPRRNRRRDVDGEICSLQNFGSVNAAKESVRAESPSFAAIERDPQRFVYSLQHVFREAVCMPLTLILSPQPGRDEIGPEGWRNVPARRVGNKSKAAC